MRDIVFKALECIKENPEYICKYLTPNDTGENGSHQSGIYINKADGRLLFTKSFKKGENVHSDILIGGLIQILTIIVNSYTMVRGEERTSLG